MHSIPITICSNALGTSTSIFNATAEMVLPSHTHTPTPAIKIILTHAKSLQNCQLYDIKKGGHLTKCLAREMIAGTKSMVCRCQGRLSAIPGKAYFGVPWFMLQMPPTEDSILTPSSSFAHKSFFLSSPTTQKCQVAPRRSSGVKELFLKQNPAAVLVTRSTDTPKMQCGQGQTSFGFFCCWQTCKAIPAGPGPSNVTSPFISFY